MPDFERRATVGVDADTAFDLLAEPAHLPDWVVGITLDDAIAVEGDPQLQDEAEARPEAPLAHFLADRPARRVEWGLPGGDYSGTAEVQPLMARLSTIIIRLHTREAADPAAVGRALDQSMKLLQRRLTGS